MNDHNKADGTPLWQKIAATAALIAALTGAATGIVKLVDVSTSDPGSSGSESQPGTDGIAGEARAVVSTGGDCRVVLKGDVTVDRRRVVSYEWWRSPSGYTGTVRELRFDGPGTKPVKSLVIRGPRSAGEAHFSMNGRYNASPPGKDSSVARFNPRC